MSDRKNGMGDQRSEPIEYIDLITHNVFERIINATSELLGDGNLTSDQTARLAAIRDEAGRALQTPQALDARTSQEAQENDDFLSMVAHELRTPLTSLRGYTQTALRQMARD